MVLCKTFVQQNKRLLNIPDAIDRFQRRKTAGFCMHQTNEKDWNLAEVFLKNKVGHCLKLSLVVFRSTLRNVYV